MKKLFIGAISLCAAALVWAAQYQVMPFFDGREGDKTIAGVIGAGAGRTNFNGAMPAGSLTNVTNPFQSNNWTRPVLLSSSPAVFVFGGRWGFGTNSLTLSGAGSNDANGPYVYAPAAGDTFGTRYTNGLEHAILLLGSYWICTNAQGLTNYRKTATSGLNSGSWILVSPGTAPVPTSTFTDATLGGRGAEMSMAWSPNGSNWVVQGAVSNTPSSTNWTATILTKPITNGYFAVWAGTNHATNGAAFTNAYLEAF